MSTTHMKLFVYYFGGVWLGGVAICLARNRAEAANLLTAKLAQHPDPDKEIHHEVDPENEEDLHEIDATSAGAYILLDEDY